MNTTSLPNLVPTETTVIVANVLPSGAAFAVRMDNGDNCYVPVTVAAAAKVVVGTETIARLVPNRFPDKADRTPWLAVHMSPALETTTSTPPVRPVQYAMPFSEFELDEQPQPALPTVADRVRAVMQEGGAWTVGSMFEELFPGKTRGDGLSDYNAVSTALRKLFADGLCAKYSMWRTSEQSKPSREWFTCHPDRVDVAEWEEA